MRFRQLRKLNLKSTHRLERLSELDQLLSEALQRLQRACRRLPYTIAMLPSPAG